MITSAANQKIKRIAQLNKRTSLRKRENVFVVEGIKMFLEAPEEHLEEIYVSESFLRNPENREAVRKLQKLGYEAVADQVFGKMSDTQAPQGILCVLRQFDWRPEQVLGKGGNPLFLVLESLQDPGNLGTIMRTGECAGITGLIMSRDTVDVYNPKTIRATMGSIYRLPFLYTEDMGELLQAMKRKGIAVYAAHLKGSKRYDEADYREAAAFVIGNEGNGLKEETAALADGCIRIPMAGKAESLNAGVAAALLMYEAARQRRWRTE